MSNMICIMYTNYVYISNLPSFTFGVVSMIILAVDAEVAIVVEMSTINCLNIKIFNELLVLI